MKEILTIISLIVYLEPGTMMANQWQVPSTYSTIQAAISAGSTHMGDSIIIAAGTYNESVSVSKSIVLIGAGASTIITPPSGSGITVSANNVVLQSLRVAHASSNGIYASGVTSLTLASVSSDSNNVSGAQLTNVTGASIVTNFSATGNKTHGLSIGAGSANISINGGTFNSNGTGRADGTGAGINMNASGGTVITNISIQGPLIADSNTTAGIWANAANTSDTIKTVTIGSTGSITLTNNGGSGVIILGCVKNATITGNFTKGAAFASGVLIVGIDFGGDSSPINAIVKKSTFSGYQSDQPAITLSAGVYPYTSVNPVTADSNTFVGATTLAAIDSLIYDFLDDPTDNLGLVTLTNNNPLPVELASFSASVRGRQVELLWHTATETNNYGFDVERRPLPIPSLSGEGIKGWGLIGFVQGMGTTNAPHSYAFNDETSSAGKFQYRLKQIDRDGRFEYSETVEVVTTLTPGDYTLSQNYPNPFNPSTKIRFAVATDEFAQVKVFDSIGKEVETLFNGIAKAGVMNELEFEGSGRSSGVYFYSLTTVRRHEFRKMLLIK